jgi:hypothetical protein
MQKALARLAWIILLGAALVFMFFTPWQRLHPTNPTLVVSTFRAPLWRHASRDVALDAIELIIEVAAVGVVSAMLLLAAHRLD